MKKFAFIIASLSLCAGFTSCSNDEDGPEEQKYTVNLDSNFPADFDSEEAEFCQQFHHIHRA